MGREGIFSGGGGISVGESGEGGVYGEGLLGIREGGFFIVIGRYLFISVRRLMYDLEGMIDLSTQAK